MHIYTLRQCLQCHFLSKDHSPTDFYTLSLHDALPICPPRHHPRREERRARRPPALGPVAAGDAQADRLPFGLSISGSNRAQRSEEHTSELQSRLHLVCRLLLEKKKKQVTIMLPLISES